MVKDKKWCSLTGTKVILNAGSYMKYPRQFGKEDRYVHFKGEAYFDVD